MEQTKSTPTSPTELVIVRSKWARGGEDDTQLLNSAGKMCCLGFYALACGYNPTEIEDYAEPETLAKNACGAVRPGYKWLLEGKENSPQAMNLMEVNDSTLFTNEHREAFIQTEFAKQGIAVTFED